MSKIRRTEEMIKLGLLPMTGEVKKHRQFVNGIPTSYISIELNHVLPQDLEAVIEILCSELESVKKELAETSALLGMAPQPDTTTEKDLYGETVRLTKSELQKLIDKHGKDATDQMIGKLDSYKKHSGKEYRSDYHAINNWVVDWYNAEGNKETMK